MRLIGIRWSKLKSLQRENFIMAYEMNSCIQKEFMKEQVKNLLGYESHVKINDDASVRNEKLVMLERDFIHHCQKFGKEPARLTDCIFLHYKYLPQHFLKLQCLHHVVDICLENCANLSKASLLCYTFILGLFKKSLIRAHTNPLPLIEDQLQTVLESDSTTLSEIGVVSGSYYKAGVKFKDRKALHEMAKKLLPLTSVELDIYDRFNVITMVKCFRLNNYWNQDVAFFIKDIIIRCSNLHLVEIAHVLAYFANSNQVDLILFNKSFYKVQEILRNHMMVSQKLHPSLGIRVKDICRCLWAASHVNYRLTSSCMQSVVAFLNLNAVKSYLSDQPHVAVDISLSLCIQDEDIPYLKSICQGYNINSLKGKSAVRVKSRFQIFKRLYEDCPFTNPVPYGKSEAVPQILKHLWHKNWKYGFIIPEIRIPGFYQFVQHQNRYICIEPMTKLNQTKGGECLLGVMELKLKILNKKNIKYLLVDACLAQTLNTDEKLFSYLIKFFEL